MRDFRLNFTKKFPWIKLNFGIHRKISKDREDLHEQLRDWYVAWKIQHGRGMYYYDLLKQPIMVFAGLKILGIPYWALIIFIPFWVIVWPCIGWLDRYKIKIWQKESKWSAEKINPWQQDLMRYVKETSERLKKIEERIGDDDEKEIKRN